MGSYDLEEEKIITLIKENQAKKVLVQLPDGLKTQAGELMRKLESETGATILCWYGSCFGACDLPVGLKSLGIDMIVAFGHNLYIKDVEGW